ncbi:MAG: arylsulfatase [Bacteroidota bacterium]
MKTRELIPLPHIFFYTILFLFTSCATKEKKDEAIQQQPPNIIYILADDLGYGDLGCYGQERIQTPNIDRMAAEGMRFTQHYAGNTVCAPSRASLLTGKHTGHVAVRGNNLTEDNLLDDNTPTIASVLKNKGYHTAIIGKWGVGLSPALNDPLKKGFDYAYGYVNMWHAHNYYPSFLVEQGKKVNIEENVQMENPPGGGYALEPYMEGAGFAKQRRTYSHDLFEQKALNYIEGNKNNPFFLYLALTIPHANNEGGDQGMEISDLGIYNEKDWPQSEKGFAAMISRMDSSVGKIMEKLKKLGLDENTLIIFVSDNGPHMEGGHSPDFFDSNGALRGEKRDLYEGGIRVPMIARWPGKIKSGSTTDHISAFWDVLPTLSELVDSEMPEEIDGISFLPTLVGNVSNQMKHDYLYWEFYAQGGKQAIRSGDWKLVKRDVRYSERLPVIELYNLSNDEGEKNNIAEENPMMLDSLEGLLQNAHSPLPDVSLFEGFIENN